MQAAVIAYRNGRLEAREQGDVWTVRLANLEVRARYLDLALAELLGNAPEAHRAAARLLGELAGVVARQEVDLSLVGPRPPRGERPHAPRNKIWQRTQLLGIRVVAFAVVASTAFLLTTWLSTVR
jgi:hypothetical protein